MPSAALGARTLLVLPPHVIEGALGAFFLVMIRARRWLDAHGLRLGLWHLALVGAVIGFLTGIVATTGPITAPLFLAYGLVKGAFLSTEAAGSLAVYLSKAVVFRRFGALPAETILALPPADGRADAHLRPHDAVEWGQVLTPSSASCSPMRGGARRIPGRAPSKESGSATTS